MADNDQKSWWEENVEDPHWARQDRIRDLYAEDSVGRLQHDIGVGIDKGIYYGAKDMAVGLFEVAKWAVLLYVHDPATEQATAEAVIKGAKHGLNLAVDVFKVEHGTLDQKKEVYDKWSKAVGDLGKAVSDKVKKDWNEASKEGKQAELVSKYVSRVGFEAAALLVGAGEASAAAKASEAAGVASKLGKVEKLGAVAAECTDAVRGAEGLSDAAKGAKALADVGPVGEWPTSAAKEHLDELQRLATEPATTNTPHLKRLESEPLGNEAAKTYLRRILDREIPEAEFKTFSGANTVNIIHVDPHGKVYVLEAKGGTSGLGTREIKYGPLAGTQVEQGTIPYLEDVARSMVASGDPEKVQSGQQILDALAKTPPKLEYIGVRGPYSKTAPATKIKPPKEIFRLP